MNNNKIKFAVVGAGHIGKRHCEMIVRNEEAELVAIADIKEKKEIGIEKFKAPFFSSIDELLSSDIEFDVINIATPNGFHAEQTLKALDKGKHVVCEKPMSLTKADSEKMIYKSLQVSKNIFVVKQNRYSPPSKWLKEMIENKRLGEVYIVKLDCYWNRDDRYYKKSDWHGDKKKDGGTLFTQFSHFVDIMYWLFGDIQKINSLFKDFNHKESTDFEDSGVVSFEFVNGGIGQINYSTSVWKANLESSITIIGEKGTIKVAGQYMNDIEYCNVENYEMPELEESSPPNDYGEYKGSAANHHFIIENVVNTLKGRTTMTTNALEGMKVVEMIERIYNS